MVALAGLIRRLLGLLVVLVAISVVAFALPRLAPGDPVETLSGEHRLSSAAHGRMRHELGLDRPLPAQYLAFVAGAVSGNLGTSIYSRRPVAAELAAALPATLELAVLALLIAAVVGVSAGWMAARRRNAALDRAFTLVAALFQSVPVYWLGLVLVLVFALALRWAPVAGRISPAFAVVPVTGFLLLDAVLAGAWDAAASAAAHLVLPVAALVPLPLAQIARTTRYAMLEEVEAAYVRTARAKGATATRASVHALNNALVPVLQAGGLIAAQLLGGAVITESVFAWPGLGRWLVLAVQHRDYPVLQGGLMVVAILVVAASLATDAAARMIDPRLRERRT